MALPADLDIYTAVEELGKNKNYFQLSQSVPPHEFVSWSSDNSDAQPTESELITAWNTYKTRTGGPDWEDFRRRRNMYLDDTDWSQGGDVPNSLKTKYQTYRQQLRDLPDNTSDPKNPNWPTKPS